MAAAEEPEQDRPHERMAEIGLMAEAGCLYVTDADRRTTWTARVPIYGFGSHGRIRQVPLNQFDASRHVLTHAERAADQLDGVFRPARLLGDETQQVEGLGMVRLGAEDDPRLRTRSLNQS